MENIQGNYVVNQRTKERLIPDMFLCLSFLLINIF